MFTIINGAYILLLVVVTCVLMIMPFFCIHAFLNERDTKNRLRVKVRWMVLAAILFPVFLYVLGSIVEMQ